MDVVKEETTLAVEERRERRGCRGLTLRWMKETAERRRFDKVTTVKICSVHDHVTTRLVSDLIRYQCHVVQVRFSRFTSFPRLHDESNNTKSKISVGRQRRWRERPRVVVVTAKQGDSVLLADFIFHGQVYLCICIRSCECAPRLTLYICK